MNVGFLATRLQSAALKVREEIERSYERLPEVFLWWAFVDLAKSGALRATRGPRAGYIRAETFFAVVREAVAPCVRVRALKEVGDEVFLCADNFRELFEAILLVDQAVHHLRLVAGSDDFPFACRAAIGSGPAKRLVRGSEDYVGRPIDDTARLMTIRPDRASLVVEAETFRSAKEVVEEYGEVVTISDVLRVPGEAAKGRPDPIFFRELEINRERLADFDSCFSPWKSSPTERPRD
jgi:class 3 adenylate cyclase